MKGFVVAAVMLNYRGNKLGAIKTQCNIILLIHWSCCKQKLLCIEFTIFYFLLKTKQF